MAIPILRFDVDLAPLKQQLDHGLVSLLRRAFNCYLVRPNPYLSRLGRPETASKVRCGPNLVASKARLQFGLADLLARA